MTADSTGPNVLLHFSAKIPPGFRVGIVGPSGGGKSTLLRLLSRHYNPSAGKLLIDGMDSHYFSARHLRRCIGYVEQEPVLLRDRTVFENIAYGCEPPPSQAEVEEACRAAAIHDKIVGTADEPGWREAGGYAAKIGAKGLLPSGGEKQRLVIARAMVRKPTIMLLDESTSALDSENEKLVTEALERLMKGKTTIMIAHRLCTTQKCDLLLFMKKGRVVEHGTHLELCALKGEYYNCASATRSRPRAKEPNELSLARTGTYVSFARDFFSLRPPLPRPIPFCSLEAAAHPNNVNSRFFLSKDEISRRTAYAVPFFTPHHLPRPMPQTPPRSPRPTARRQIATAAGRAGPRSFAACPFL